MFHHLKRLKCHKEISKKMFMHQSYRGELSAAFSSFQDRQANKLINTLEINCIIHHVGSRAFKAGSHTDKGVYRPLNGTNERAACQGAGRAPLLGNNSLKTHFHLLPVLSAPLLWNSTALVVCSEMCPGMNTSNIWNKNPLCSPSPRSLRASLDGNISKQQAGCEGQGLGRTAHSMARNRNKILPVAPTRPYLKLHIPLICHYLFYNSWDKGAKYN